MGIGPVGGRGHRVGGHRSSLQVLGYVAARDQHGNHGGDLLDGLRVQNSQNRASKAVQLKLDEVIRALDGAENKFIRLEAAAEGVIAEREAEMDVIAVDTAVSGSPDAAGPSLRAKATGTGNPAPAVPSSAGPVRKSGGRTQATRTYRQS
jgi:hypothetical protein